jgi:hypothetical protein
MGKEFGIGVHEFSRNYSQQFVMISEIRGSNWEFGVGSPERERSTLCSETLNPEAQLFKSDLATFQQAFGPAPIIG